MKTILAIGAGSFAGGIARYLLTESIQRRFPISFPAGTFAVNIIGCFLIGIVYGLADRGHLNPYWTTILATGFIGGFTTFSAFSYQNVELLRGGQVLLTLGYAAASVSLGCLATYTALMLTKWLIPT